MPVDLLALARKILATRSTTKAKTVVLLSCTAHKDPHATTARDLYSPSDLFREGVAYAERRGAPWAVLSAKHGLLLPEDRVTWYDQKLEGVAARSLWADRVIATLEAQGWADGAVRIEIHAGKSYAHPLADRLRERGVVVDEPLARLGTGYRRSFYKKDREGSRSVVREGRKQKAAKQGRQILFVIPDEDHGFVFFDPERPRQICEFGWNHSKGKWYEERHEIDRWIPYTDGVSILFPDSRVWTGDAILTENEFFQKLVDKGMEAHALKRVHEAALRYAGEIVDG